MTKATFGAGRFGGVEATFRQKMQQWNLPDSFIAMRQGKSAVTS